MTLAANTTANTITDEVVENVTKITKAIVDTKDVNFTGDDTRYLITVLLNVLVEKASRYPVFVAAVLQHLHSKGFKINTLKGEAMDFFQRNLMHKLARLNKTQMDEATKIAKDTFE